MRTYLHSRPSFHMQNHRRRLLCIVGSRALVQSPPHLVYFLAIFSPLFRLLSHPSAPPLLYPYLILPIGLTRDASLHHPFSLPLLCPFISSTSVFGSKPRPFVPFQRHADKWISLLIKSFTRPPFFFRSSHPPSSNVISSSSYSYPSVSSSPLYSFAPLFTLFYLVADRVHAGDSNDYYFSLLCAQPLFIIPATSLNVRIYYWNVTVFGIRVTVKRTHPLYVPGVSHTPAGTTTD